MNAKLVLLFLLTTLVLPSASFAQTTPVIALQNLAHTAESLHKTVPFYRDVIGLPLNGARDPLAQQPQALDEDMSKFTATKGAKFRAAIFRIPNASFGFELTEFTAGGAPVNDSGNANSKKRDILIRDPDGFFVGLQQPDPLPAVAATTTGDILGGSVWLSIEDSAKTVAFLRDAIGFTVRLTSPLTTHPVAANLINLQGVQWRITYGRIPGTTLDFCLVEYSGVLRTPFVMGAEDPGSPAFTMVVSDIDAAVDQWTRAGGTVVTTGGKAIKRANGAGNVFVRDVNGFMWELIQRADR